MDHIFNSALLKTVLMYAGGWSSLFYYITHSNGKRSLYLLIGILLMFAGSFTLVQLLDFHVDPYTESIIEILILFIPLWHLRIDWTQYAKK